MSFFFMFLGISEVDLRTCQATNLIQPSLRKDERKRDDQIDGLMVDDENLPPTSRTLLGN